LDKALAVRKSGWSKVSTSVCFHCWAFCLKRLSKDAQIQLSYGLPVRCTSRLYAWLPTVHNQHWQPLPMFCPKAAWVCMKMIIFCTGL